MLTKPQKGEEVLAWAQRLHDELQPLLRLAAGAGLLLLKSPGGWLLKLARERWTGNCWVDHVLYTGFNQAPEKRWVKIDKNTSPPSITEELGPPPSSWGQGIEWRCKDWCPEIVV